MFPKLLISFCEFQTKSKGIKTKAKIKKTKTPKGKDIKKESPVVKVANTSAEP